MDFNQIAKKMAFDFSIKISRDQHQRMYRQRVHLCGDGGGTMAIDMSQLLLCWYENNVCMFVICCVEEVN